MLKTNCIKCIFDNRIVGNQGCALHKEVFQIDGRQYTNGYCRHKRGAKWLGANKFDIGELHEKIISEENTYAISLAILDNSIENFDKTLSNIKQIKLFSEIAVGMLKVKKEFLLYAVEKIAKLGMAWRLEDIQSDMIITAHDVHNYMFPETQNNWLVQIENGDELDYGQINKASIDIVHNNENHVLYFLNNNKYLINKFVFGELGGHHERDVLTKIKEFSNWEQVCCKI